MGPAWASPPTTWRISCARRPPGRSRERVLLGQTGTRDDHDSRRASRPGTRGPRPAGALGLGGGGRRLRDAGGCRGLPLGAGGADRAAERGVRLVPRTDRLRGLAQPHALRPDVALRGRAHGPLRRTPGRHRRADPGRAGKRPHRVHDRAVAADPVLGTARRAGHRIHVDGVRRHDHEPLVRRPPRSGQRHPDRRQRDRPAGLPAGGGVAGDRARLAYGGAPRGRRRAGGDPAGPAAPAQPPGRPRPACLRRHPRRPRPAAPPAGRVQRRARTGRAARRRAEPDVLAALRRLRHLRDDHQRAHRHPLRAGRARPRHAGHDRRVAPGGRRAGSPTRSTRGCCWSATTSCAGSA